MRHPRRALSSILLEYDHGLLLRALSAVEVGQILLDHLHLISKSSLYSLSR